jgi:ABC-type polysaccharide/polyol phosphate transport system ATPase subunit
MIVAERVGVRFLFDRQQRVVTAGAARLRRIGSETWGLRDVSFSIGPGESVALLGASGSGKTTLLRLLGGIYSPDEGRLEVAGRVGTLLSVEAGLLSVLTGRENALQLGVLAGMSRAQTRATLGQVKERSRLEEYFERPVSSYSQGMRARLGFAVAEATEPQILLLDEVHEALDHEFRQVIEEKARTIVDGGGIVVAAGHDHAMLERLCERALHLEHGSVHADGPIVPVRDAYLAATVPAG